MGQHAKDIYVPQFDVKVSGQDLLRKNADILSLTVTDSLNQADTFSMQIRELHPKPARFPSGERLRWIDDALFTVGSKVNIRLGYLHNMAFEFMGEITATSIDFPEDGMPLVTVRGASYWQRLQRARRRKPFVNKTDSEIVQELARDVGLSADVDKTQIKREKVLFREPTTYANIVKQRAERMGYEFAVKGKTLLFVEPNYRKRPGAKLTLTWGVDLNSFRPQMNTYGLFTEVEVLAEQTSTGGPKTTIRGNARAGQEKVIMGSTSASQFAKAKFGANAVSSQYKDIVSKAEADAVALAQLEAKSQEFISGTGVCIGNPNLTARQVIKLADLGKQFTGEYYVVQTTHTLNSSGYQTQFTVNRNGI